LAKLLKKVNAHSIGGIEIRKLSLALQPAFRQTDVGGS